MFDSIELIKMSLNNWKVLPQKHLKRESQSFHIKKVMNAQIMFVICMFIQTRKLSQNTKQFK